MIETYDLSKPGYKKLDSERTVLNGRNQHKDKKGWIPCDSYIRNGIAALTELSKAGYDLANFDEDKLGEIFWNLNLFDKYAHWTYIKVMRRYWSKKKACAADKARTDQTVITE